MGFEAAALAITASTAAASAATAGAAASQQRGAVQRSRQATMRAAEVRRSQVARAAELERTKARNQAEMLRGRLRTSAAGRGVGAGGSVQLLEQQIDFDLGLRNAVENANESNFQAAIGSDMSARLASLLSENPLMASFVGGLQGASTGLAITGAADELDLLPKRIP